MYTGHDFTPLASDERITLTFDFANNMRPGSEIIHSVWTCDLVSGTDETPADRLDGPSAYQGTLSMQRVTGLQAGAKYRLRALVTTSYGDTMSLFSHCTGKNP
jgi:hypothetical protein